MPNELIIKVCNHWVYFNRYYSIPIQQTNIPKDHLTFRANNDMFWKVKMISYNTEYESLKVSVIDYNSNDISKFEEQDPKKIVKEILFERFDWQKFEPLLSYYQKSKLKEILYNIEITPYSKGKKDILIQVKPSSSFAKIQPISSNHNYIQNPIIETISENSWIYFTDARFILGYVTFKMYVKKFNKMLEFKIPNEHILEEFNHIKYWFQKKLKTERFKAVVSITYSGDEIKETTASSKHIDQITPDLIESVKTHRTSSLTKPPRINDQGKSIFTAEEIFKQIDSDNIEENIFNQSEEDILNFFLTKREIRNKKQLEYLAGTEQSLKHKLHFTLNPHFGFLFFIEGKNNNHFVWELLDSHATYIWSFEKNNQISDLPFKRIEKSINKIKEIGREEYKREYKTNNLDNDIFFRIINHKGIASMTDDDFQNWKSRLNEQLT